MKKILLILSFIIIADVVHFIQTDDIEVVGVYKTNKIDKDSAIKGTPLWHEQAEMICNKLCEKSHGNLSTDKWNGESKLNEKGNIVCTCLQTHVSM